MSDAPERIFLQDAGDYARAAAFEVTWCIEPQDDADTEYIRADKVAALVKAVEALGVRKMVAGWNGEGRETPYTPHPPHLWAKITTTCGAVYALDAALAAFKGDAQ